ncbi:MAG: hypothetical protein GWO41_04910 [candidate division Zixibacteria bacterium]|nr:hypothetical protein [candidate division Zixibacteria bacterium]NIR64138.1 hypothetical protein [candidate division Zixibacteria bacterium]NIS15564.1 hypothetical protein [candidate division Zixibacteria bacterium]NIS46040.1 hypothetical protein [candidate division Zixibacteria bacterium]NIT52089.1 hypothetical protein [candidate division Zixibacteria bacterium]
MKKIFFVFAAAILLLAITACEQEPAERARSAVLDFVKALRSEGSIELDNYLILSEVVRENAENVYAYNDSLSVSQNIEQFRKLFEPNGRVRRLWTEKQIIVGGSEVLGDTAYVEVSFIDREERRQFYNKMGLKRTDEGWKIFAFKLL